MTPVNEIETQCAAIRSVLAGTTCPHTAAELRDTLAAKFGTRPWLTVETIQRRLNRMAAEGRVRIYKRSGPRGQHCYGPMTEFVDKRAEGARE
jgi:hypothetical protein